MIAASSFRPSGNGELQLLICLLVMPQLIYVNSGYCHGRYSRRGTGTRQATRFGDQHRSRSRTRQPRTNANRTLAGTNL